MRRPLLLAFGALLPFLAQDARAHPHVLTTIETEILYDRAQMVAGLRHHWTFDKFYSAFATEGLDKNGDGKLEAAELAELAHENVVSLKEYDYFTFVTVDEKPAELLEPKDYSLDHANGKLTLHFTLPLSTPIDARLGDVSFAVYDSSYYIAFELAKESPVKLSGSAPAPCKAKVLAQAPAPATSQRLSEAFFSALGAGSNYGAQFPNQVAIDCKQ